MPDYIPVFTLVVAIAAIIAPIYRTYSKKARQRRERIDVLKKEQSELNRFIQRVEEMGAADHGDPVLEPLRELLRSCHRVFDENFMAMALQQLHQVRASKDEVVRVSRRIRTVEQADQAALGAAQADLVRARGAAIALMRAAAGDELRRVGDELRQLGELPTHAFGSDTAA